MMTAEERYVVLNSLAQCELLLQLNNFDIQVFDMHFKAFGFYSEEIEEKAKGLESVYPVSVKCTVVKPQRRNKKVKLSIVVTLLEEADAELTIGLLRMNNKLFPDAKWILKDL